MHIHPTAIVDSSAKLAPDVTIGPYSIVGKDVTIGPGTTVTSHCVITGPTVIGVGNTIGPFATIGAPPQDLKYKGEPTELIIGDHNVIREYVSIHRGTPTGIGHTRIGNRNLLMGYVHIAHDCVLSDRVIMANAATLAGHVQIEEHAIIGGLTAVHQFTRIGAHCYIGGMSGINRDVPPYVIVSGIRDQMRVSGINRVGLKRAGFSSETIRRLIEAFKIIFRTPDLLLQEALDKALAAAPDCPEVARMVNFFRTSERSVVRAAGGEDG